MASKWIALRQFVSPIFGFVNKDDVLEGDGTVYAALIDLGDIALVDETPNVETQTDEVKADNGGDENKKAAGPVENKAKRKRV